MKHITILFLFIVSISLSQNVMKLDCNLMANNSKDSLHITIIDEQMHKTILYEYNKFYYEMQLNTNYSILFEKKGYNSQLIYFNNHITLNGNIICYFNINLISTDNSEILNIIRVYYDSKLKQFNYKLINF